MAGIKNILLVEDDLKSRYALQSVLQDLGHTVTACIDAEEAQKSTNTFDAAIIDVRLPLQQGPDFAIALKKRSPHCRIIFITAYDTLHHLKETIPGSVMLVKPIELDILIKLL